MHATFNKGQSMGRYPQLCRRLDPKFVLLSFLLLCTTLFLSGRASALPSDARQTGHPCIKRHVGEFGPHLTPYGVRLKIGACSETDLKGLKIAVAMFAFGGFAISQVGASSNYDGMGRNASDNDSLYMFVWTAI
jgi:hypothetical protein